MNCKDVQRCVHAFIDEELDPKQIVEFEAHLAECEHCQGSVTFERWFKSELKETIGRTTAPPQLSKQIRASLERAERTQRFRQLLPRAGLVAAIAASVLAALLLPEWLEPDLPQPMAAHRPVIDYVAERHARSLPIEVSGPDRNNVARWFRGKVDFAVYPPLFRSNQVQLVGGRISHVGDRQAAHLIYEHNGHPITLIVFEDRPDLPLGGIQQRAGNQTVYLGQSRGYNVAVWQNGGVSYAVSSDIDRNDMIQLVSLAQ
jgi:mycothiol system anti-sigma-R factor